MMSTIHRNPKKPKKSKYCHPISVRPNHSPQNVEIVNNAPFPHDYHTFNPPTVYPPLRLNNYPTSTRQHHVNTDRAPVLFLPQMPLPAQYPPPWASAHHIPPQPATPLAQSIIHPHPPPYQYPQHGSSLATALNAEDVSDGEDSEVEIVDGELDDPAAVQVSNYLIQPSIILIFPVSPSA